MKKLFGILAISVLAVSLTEDKRHGKNLCDGYRPFGPGRKRDRPGRQKVGRASGKKEQGQGKGEIYPAEQMGKEADIVTSMQMGSVEASLMGTTLYKQAAPEYNIWSAYYLFSDSKEAMALQKHQGGGKVPPGGAEEQGQSALWVTACAAHAISPPTGP